MPKTPEHLDSQGSLLARGEEGSDLTCYGFLVAWGVFWGTGISGESSGLAESKEAGGAN